MKCVVLDRGMCVLFACLLLSEAVMADNSRWSASINYSQFSPELAAWDETYDDNHMRGWQATWAYQMASMVSMGLGVGSYHASGRGLLPQNNSLGGEVDYTIYPVELYIELQARFKRSQWLVPYVGGGYDLVYYMLDIAHQSGREGKAQGSHYKLGLRFSLNQLDRMSAQQLERAWGIENTLLVLEVKRLDVEKSGFDLGGDSYLFGLMFEF